MSWHFSRALVEEYLADTCSDGEQSVPSRLIHIRETSCSRGKMTEHCPLPSPCGMTSQPLTESLGEELLTWYLEGFPVKTSVQPERGKESTEQEADSGESLQESFARFDHSTHSWKTPQCSLLEVSEEFSATWPRWGIMRRGVCSELPIWELRTSGKEYGFSDLIPKLLARGGGLDEDSSNRKGGPLWLPTPICHDAKDLAPSPSAIRRKSPSLATLAAHGKLGPAGKLSPDWTEWLMGWPIGWTDLKPLETDRFHVWQQQCSNTLEESWKGETTNKDEV